MEPGGAASRNRVVETTGSVLFGMEASCSSPAGLPARGDGGGGGGTAFHGTGRPMPLPLLLVGAITTRMGGC